MEWYLKVMRDNYANFNGRARRKEYWMFSLFYFLFLMVAGIIGALLMTALNSEAGVGIFGFLMFIGVLAHLVPGLAVTVRRLHDTGKSGWLYLLAFIPYIGSLIIFIFTVMDGEKGENKWGPDPKA